MFLQPVYCPHVVLLHCNLDVNSLTLVPLLSLLVALMLVAQITSLVLVQISFWFLHCTCIAEVMGANPVWLKG